MTGGTIILPWPPERISELRRLHGTMSIAALADHFGTTIGAIRGQVTRQGLSKKGRWPQGLIDELTALYQAAGADGVLGLASIASKWGKEKANLSRKARHLGLPTSLTRRCVEARKDRRKYQTDGELRAALSVAAKERIRANGHPRGMAGKRHTFETKIRLSEISAARWDAMTPAERDAHTLNAMKANLEKNGRVSAPGPGRGSWKAGWREIGGKRNYYRSRWEANYARYLEWLKVRGEIQDWEYEPETFWFEAIKRGVRSYLPDFRVRENDGSKPLHEVKGWMDARSKTTLRRMKKYHPAERIILIRERDYNAIARTVSGLIEGWEYSDRKGRW